MKKNNNFNKLVEEARSLFYSTFNKPGTDVGVWRHPVKEILSIYVKTEDLTWRQDFHLAYFENIEEMRREIQEAVEDWK